MDEMRLDRVVLGLILFTVLLAPAAAHTGDGQRKVPPPYEPAPPSEEVDLGEVEPFCPGNSSGWREAQTVMGVDIAADPSCSPDDPRVVAAVTKGTDEIPRMMRMQTGLSEDAVVKGEDRDGDGDPDVVNITLEVAEINGKAPEGDILSSRQEIAPGIAPGFWVFAPKTMGMASEGAAASDLLRMPSAPIRVEQGDEVTVELENTHYMPHTIHFHGTDHAYMEGGEGNEGVPQTSEKPVNPGDSRTYSFTPRQSGTMFYHCHVQPSTHVLMGLQGMFVIAEERTNNTMQTFNIGGGRVRNPPKAVEERYDRVYDMHYTDVDHELHEIVNVSNDPRVVSKMMNRGYDVTEREAEYFLLNGKSFPYTARESQVIVEEDEEVKMRVLNGGEESVSLHTHGHKPTATHLDGIRQGFNITRDVFHLSAAQRTDLVLNTTDNGLQSYGPGVWFTHNHRERAVTTDGIGPGGDVTMITYESFLKDDGFPELNGVSWEPYFTEEYYDRQVPVWNTYTEPRLFGEVPLRPPQTWVIVLLGLIGLLIGGGVTWFALQRR